MSNKLIVSFVAESFHSTKKDKDFYVIRPCLSKDGKVVLKGSPIIWLTKELYDEYTSK